MYWNDNGYPINVPLISSWIITWDVLKLLSATVTKTIKCGWIITWGVLKSTKDGQKIYAKDQLNNNMGCIEIKINSFYLTLTHPLNNNMGCIEIRRKYWSTKPLQLNNNMGCIEIVDINIGRRFWLNNNMECIEMKLYLM